MEVISIVMIACVALVFMLGIFSPKVRTSRDAETTKEDVSQESEERVVKHPATGKKVKEPRIQKVLNGLLYDTEEATCLGIVVDSTNPKGRYYWFAYRTKRLRYFLCNYSGTMLLTESKDGIRDSFALHNSEALNKWFLNFKVQKA